MTKKHKEKLDGLHADAVAAGLVVRFWSAGVLVVCSPEHGGKEESNAEMALGDGKKQGEGGAD